MVKDRLLVWDLPVRIVHVVLALGFLTAYGIAKLQGEDSPNFPYHMMVGLTVALVVALRIIWGIVGTRWSRFGTLKLNPSDLTAYFATVFSKDKKSYVGHNPATSAAMVLIFALVLGLAFTGYQYTLGNESFEKVHSLMANALLFVALAHVAGVLLHGVVTNDRVLVSMVDGRKTVDASDAIPKPAVPAAAILLLVVGGFLGSLVSNYDSAAKSTKLPLFGTRVALGEGPEGAAEAGGHETEEGDQDDDD